MTKIRIFICFAALAAGAEARVLRPAKQTRSPMSCMHNGRQYILIAVSGQGNAGAEILAYALP